MKRRRGMRLSLLIGLERGILKPIYFILLLRFCIRSDIVREILIKSPKINYKILKDLKNYLCKRGEGTAQRYIYPEKFIYKLALLQYHQMPV